MDFPMFFLDYVGNRLLIAVIGAIHVFINHPLAVGAYPLVMLMEYWGFRRKDADWDALAYRITFVLFIITTSVGALTGVGIWLSTALIAPFGIGSLLRVFFWAWFIEWLVFISEVVLVVIYFLTWKRWSQGGWKKLHIGVGVLLSVCSWLTMVIIVAILGFMMGSGGWPADRSLFSAVFNPLYIPQLAFRTTYAMMLAGLCAWFLIFFFTQKKTEFRRRAVRCVSFWILAWAAPFVAAAVWYWNKVPTVMQANIDVGLLTQRFMSWHETFALIIVAAVALIVIAAIIGAIRPRLVPAVVLLIPFVMGLWMLGHFERVREFIRKPYVIADYMYSNGVRVDELPVFQRDGVLPYATYVNNRTVTSANMVAAGRDVFMVTCSRCHTSYGVNGMMSKFTNLYGHEPWDADAMTAFVQTMHTARTFMPPFPGNDKEAEALVAYLKHLQTSPELILGAQADWRPKSELQQKPSGGP